MPISWIAEDSTTSTGAYILRGLNRKKQGVQGGNPYAAVRNVLSDSDASGSSASDSTENQKVSLAAWFVGFLSHELEGVQIRREHKGLVASLLLVYVQSLRLSEGFALEETVLRFDDFGSSRIFALEGTVAKFMHHRRNKIAEMLIPEQYDLGGRDPVRNPDWNKCQSGLDWDGWSSKDDVDFRPSFVPAYRPGHIDLRSVTDEDEDCHIDSAEQAAAKRFVFDNDHYSWFISQLKRELLLQSTGTTSSVVRNELTRGLQANGQLSIKLEWDPIVFLEHQYGPDHGVPLADVLCLVGTATCAYASTCREYLGLMWPRVGSDLIVKLDHWTVSRAHPAERKELSVYGVTLDLTLEDGWLSCTAFAEVGAHAVDLCEIICWLSAAYRANPPSTSREACPGLCIPIVSPARSTETVLLVRSGHRDLNNGSEMSEEDTCWQSIFWNPTVTGGYPIPARDPSPKGLQIGLETMAGLIEISRAMIYGDILMLKGLSNMFVPTAVTGTSVTWHYMSNEDLSWMSHNRAEEVCKTLTKIDFEALETATAHYVGWLQITEINTGNVETKYDTIEYTGNDMVNSHFEVLQEMRSHRAKSKPCGTQQYEVRKFWTKNFVGIGCLDIVSGKSLLCPRFRGLRSTAAQWLRLADAIDSINIIGAGIDDLLVPSSRHQNLHLSPPWDSDVLTVPINRLDRISREFGNAEYPYCVELAQGIFWSDPEGAFNYASCLCNKKKPQSCCGRSIAELRDRRQKALKRLRNTGSLFAHVVKKYRAAALCFGSKNLLPHLGPLSTSWSRRLFSAMPRHQSPSTSISILSTSAVQFTPESTPLTRLRSNESRTSNVEEQAR